ncbi:FAD-dependent oxidoreductase [Nocardioides sp. LHD-245]|uniref:FAD-dependent oxidoreductase n=1 Tax=Nocardioides sp. LHD-245 TaxID=3051387 RepID=UPI0027E1FADD|nr:FAD-dependent oxidoreductase [Nocardioides sp. LHD-245]
MSDYDVVVVGAGLAGNAAALTAAEAGASVLLLEKGERYGGTSVKAGGGLVFAGTDLQTAAGVSDNGERLREALLATGRGQNDPDTVQAYLDHQLDTYAWMRERGVVFDYHADLQPPHLNRLHGTAPGQATDALHTRALAHPDVTYRPRCRALRLRRGGDGRVDGVSVVAADADRGEETVGARRGVVLASGGFARSDALVRTFAPQWLEATRMGGADNTGDGLTMAWALGAGLADMAQVEASFGASVPNFPDLDDTGGAEPKLLYANAQGAVIVNREARRFVNEALNYKQISGVCARQTDGLAFQVFDQRIMDRSLPHPLPSDFKGALAEGRVLAADTLAGLAALTGLDEAALTATLAAYNSYVEAGEDPDFGRPVTAFDDGRIAVAPFYAYPCRNGLTTTYCGLTVDRSLRVLDVFGEPIEGLYAAGEVVGGFHGAAYYSGTGLGKAAVLGRGAGLAVAG